MSVIEPYLPIGSTGRPYTERWRIPAPRGTSLGQMSTLELWNEIAESMGLPQVGVYTLWAARESDTTWDPIGTQPDTNYLVWGLSDRAIQQAEQLAHGHPLPFVSVLTERPLSTTAVQKLWENSLYAPYQTDAVFRQDDPKTVPQIYFLHWGERRDLSEQPLTPKTAEQVARDAGGRLVFVAQAAQESTTQRDFPLGDFEWALKTQLDPGLDDEPDDVPADVMPAPQAPQAPQAPKSARKPSYVVPVLVGVGAAAITFMAVRRRRDDDV